MGTIKRRLPKKLSPKARKLLLTARPGERCHALVRVGPAADRVEFGRQVAEAGGTVQAWLGEADLVSVELPADRLGELADADSVVSVEVGETYRPAAS
jgi:hypothetical protein